MKSIAVLYPYGCIGAAWSVTGGLVTTLRRKLGIDAIPFKIATDNAPFQMPMMEELMRFDAIIISGPEWIGDAIKKHYGTQWRVALKVPKAAIYHESNERDDRTFHFEGRQTLADYHFYPAIQDAEKFNGTWLPFGVDTDIFTPEPFAGGVDTGFVGNVYGKRGEFLRSLIPFNLHVYSNVGNNNDDGTLNEKASTQKLAALYRNIRLFVNLPTLSQLTVTKVYEVMGAGRPCLTPVPQGDVRNMHLKNLGYYENGEQLKTLAKYYLDNPEEREEMALAGCKEVHEHHRLDQRLRVVVEKLFS
jgi:hypothetical protein